MYFKLRARMRWTVTLSFNLSSKFNNVSKTIGEVTPTPRLNIIFNGRDAYDVMGRREMVRQDVWSEFQMMKARVIVRDAKLQKGIQTVSYKSIGKLMEWKKENPDYRGDADLKFSNVCMVMHKNSIAGYDRETYYPKVIHSIAKEIIVDK